MKVMNKVEELALRTLSLIYGEGEKAERAAHPYELSLRRTIRQASRVAHEKGWYTEIVRAVHAGDVETACAYAVASVMLTHTLLSYGGVDEMSWTHLTYTCYTVYTWLVGQLEKGKKPKPEKLFRSVCNGLWTRVASQIRVGRTPERGRLGEIFWDVVQYFGLVPSENHTTYTETEKDEYHHGELPPYMHFSVGAWTDGLQNRAEAKDFVERLLQQYPHLRAEIEKALFGDDVEIEKLAQKLRPLVLEREVTV